MSEMHSAQVGFLIKKLITLATSDEEDGLGELSEYMSEADGRLNKSREIYHAGMTDGDQESGMVRQALKLLLQLPISF